MKINKYPDGTSYITIPEDWEDSFQEITFKVNTYEDLWHLVQLCEVMTWNNIEAIITIPCLLDAQADRRFDTLQSSSLPIIANVLNSFGNISFKIYHPHNPEVVEALFNRVEIIDNIDFIKGVIDNIAKINNDTFLPNNLILMSSDAGGFKPLMKLCDKINWKGGFYSASKSRNHLTVGAAKLVQVVDRQDFDGKDILIIDDICVYGGTFKGLAKLLREKNVGKLYLAVSHMTIRELGKTDLFSLYDKVFTTNSKYDNYFIQKDKKPLDNWYQPDNLEIIKLFNV